MASGHDTLKRDGGWSVELVTPLMRRDGTMIDVVDLKPAELDQIIRWGMGDIPSTLSMLSEMCGLSESLLRTLKYPDVDRVMLAYSQVIPPVVRKDFEEGTRPFATPQDDLPVGDRETVGGTNTLFPKVAGDVKPFTSPPTEPPNLGQERRRAPPLPPTQARPMPTTTMHIEDQGGVNFSVPEGAKRVG